MARKWMMAGILAAAVLFAACGAKNDATKTDGSRETASEQKENATKETVRESQSGQTAPPSESFGTVTEDGRYVSENGKMSFVLPEGFRKTDSNDTVDFVSAEYPLRADNIHFTTTENAGGLSFYTKEILETLYAENESYQDISVVSTEQVTIGGCPAVKVTMTFTMDKTPIEQVQAYMEYGDLIYHLYYSRVTDLKVDFDACLSTVVFY